MLHAAVKELAYRNQNGLEVTLQQHLERVYRKLDISSRRELATAVAAPGVAPQRLT